MTIPAQFGSMARFVIEVTREHPDWNNKDIASAARTKMLAHMSKLAAASAASRRANAGLDATGLDDAGSDGTDL